MLSAHEAAEQVHMLMSAGMLEDAAYLIQQLLDDSYQAGYEDAGGEPVDFDDDSEDETDINDFLYGK